MLSNTSKRTLIVGLCMMMLAGTSTITECKKSKKNKQPWKLSPKTVLVSSAEIGVSSVAVTGGVALAGFSSLLFSNSISYFSKKKCLYCIVPFLAASGIGAGFSSVVGGFAGLIDGMKRFFGYSPLIDFSEKETEEEENEEKNTLQA